MRHRGAAPGDVEIFDSLRDDHAKRQLVETARLGDCRKTDDDVAWNVRFYRPAVHADGVGEVGAVHDVVDRQLIAADDAACLANADLWRNIDDVGPLEIRHVLVDEVEDLPDLPPPFELP